MAEIWACISNAVFLPVLERQIGKELERKMVGQKKVFLRRAWSPEEETRRKTEKKRGRNTFMGDKDSDATESFQGRPKSHYGECNGADWRKGLYGVSTRQKAVLDWGGGRGGSRSRRSKCQCVCVWESEGECPSPPSSSTPDASSRDVQ